jgi:hypothetical protein
MCTAWLRRRLPRRDSRQALRLPEDTPGRRGAVIGGEVIPAGEPGRVTGLADDNGCHDRAHAEDPGEGGAAGLDRRRQLLPGLVHLGVDPAQVPGEVSGQLAAGPGDGPGHGDLAQDTGSLRRADPLGEPARNQFAQHRVQPACDLGPCPAQVPVPPGPHLEHHGMVIGPDRPASG